MNEADEEAWCADLRDRVVGYLAAQGLTHGAVGSWPAWHVDPYVSIWAVESLKSPGMVGWWVIAGDLPTDYCSGEGCSTPRDAVTCIAQTWRDALQKTKPDASVIQGLGLDISLSPLLETRSALLLSWAQDDSFWSG